ncbi:hypothetical protein, partial [Nocardia tengchongensis]
NYSPTYRWRDLIPFFIHGNIAEPDTYDIQTDELARSAADSMLRLLEENAGLTFQFACAIDETACGSPMIARAPGETIREKMRKFIGAEHADKIRLDFDPKNPFQNGRYSSCALNGIVHSYYEDKPGIRTRILAEAEAELGGAPTPAAIGTRATSSPR